MAPPSRTEIYLVLELEFAGEKRVPELEVGRTMARMELGCAKKTSCVI
jgi:hypothetical protein